MGQDCLSVDIQYVFVYKLHSVDQNTRFTSKVRTVWKVKVQCFRWFYVSESPHKGTNANVCSGKSYIISK